MRLCLSTDNQTGGVCAPHAEREMRECAHTGREGEPSPSALEILEIWDIADVAGAELPAECEVADKREDMSGASRWNTRQERTSGIRSAQTQT
jgi:hypothetical protein